MALIIRNIIRNQRPFPTDIIGPINTSNFSTNAEKQSEKCKQKSCLTFLGKISEMLRPWVPKFGIEGSLKITSEISNTETVTNKRKCIKLKLKCLAK